MSYAYRNDRIPTVYADVTFTRGEALTTYVVAEGGKTKLQDGDGLGSLIRVTEDQETANCTWEFDEVMNAYVVRCMTSKESIPEQTELFLLGPKLVKSKRSIMYSIPSSFVEDRPVEVEKAEPTRKIATFEVQTEEMEVEEEPVFIESDLEQYELCRRVIPVEEYFDPSYANALFDELKNA
jgi:hypothetical protein